LANPLLIVSVVWGGVVVADDVDVQLIGDRFVDGDQEFTELDRAVAAVELGDDFAGSDVERREQAPDPWRM
jgi:hypothetical protein